MFIFKKMSLRYPSLNSHCSLFGSHSFKWKWRSGERGLVPLTVQTISWVLFLKTNDCTSECNRRGFVLLCILSHTILKDRQVPGNPDSMKPVTFAASSRVRLRGWLFLPFNGVCVCVCCGGRQCPLLQWPLLPPPWFVLRYLCTIRANINTVKDGRNTFSLQMKIAEPCS